MTDQELIDKGYKEGKKSFEYLVKQILDHFDFEQVHEVMKLTGWEWGLAQREDNYIIMGIPSLEHIKRTAYDYLKQAYEEKRVTGSGGFRAVYEDNMLTLEFNLCNWTGE